MSGTGFQKTIAWAVITAFLHLVLSLAPGSMVAAQSHDNLQSTSIQSSVPGCQADISAPPQFGSLDKMDCPANICDERCSVCVHVGAVIPADADLTAIPVRKTVDTAGRSRLIDPGYAPITPPPRLLLN